MNQTERPETEFSRRLRAELTAIVAERGAAEAAEQDTAPETGATPPAWRRRGPRLALGGGVAVLALAAAALVISAGGSETPKAFAIEAAPGGGETVRIYSLKEAPALEAALEKAGIRAQVTWLPTGMACREPHFTPSIVHLPGGGSFGGMTIGGPGRDGITLAISPTAQYRKRLTNRHWRERHPNVPVANLNLDPQAFRPDQSVVLSGDPLPYLGDPEGAFEASVDIAAGPVKPCEPVPGPKDHEVLRMDEEQARHDPKFKQATTGGR
jgi:hypothetical protein